MSGIFVRITGGSYRNTSVNGVYPVIEKFKITPSGVGRITISNANPIPGHPSTQRVTCTEQDIQYVDSLGSEMDSEVIPANKITTNQLVADHATAYVAHESEDEALARIKETFEMLSTVTNACAMGHVRGVVVSGPPGIGKSFGVEETLTDYNLMNVMAGKDPMYQIVSGGISPIGLYQTLYWNRSKEQVLVFDDCDGVLFDDESLNILKAALGSGKKRTISYLKESRALKEADIPNAFEFNGAVIFITNMDFDAQIARNSKLSPHLAAIKSRCHYLNLDLHTQNDVILRIKQVVRDGMLNEYNFTTEEHDNVMNFILNNIDYLEELSLRMVTKVADAVRSMPKAWYAFAEATCLKRGAKFKRLAAERKAKEAEAEAEMAQIVLEVETTEETTIVQ